MENTKTASENSPAMPPDYLPRNKIYSVIMVPLALLLGIFSGGRIWAILFAMTRTLTSDIPPMIRVFQHSLGFVVAIAGIIMAIIALTGSLKVSRFYNAGNYEAAAAASKKAEKPGKIMLLLTGLICVFLILYILKLW